MPTKKPKRKAVKVKPAAAIKPVEIMKVALEPDKIVHVVPPPDHVPIVALHPSKSVVEIAAVPKKRTLLQRIFGG